MKLTLLVFFSVFMLVASQVNDKYLLNRYNMLRRGFAKTNAIPNMWELTWDTSLVKKIASLPANCSNIRPGKDYRFFYTGGSETNRLFDQHWIEWFAKTEKSDPVAVTAKNKEWEKVSAHFLEFVNPIQTKIGCSTKICDVIGEPDFRLHYDVICLLGPHGNLGIYLPINEKSGKIPGSECGKDGKNEDGLCVKK